MANSKKSDNRKSKRTQYHESLLPVMKPNKSGTFTGVHTVITPRVLDKLREAFLIGCDDAEACLNAEISTATLYNHQKANPAFLEWKEALKRTPFLKARKTIVDHLERDPEFALRYMERKKKAEFSPTLKIKNDDEVKTLDDDQKASMGNMMAMHMAKLAAKQNDEK